MSFSSSRYATLRTPSVAASDAAIRDEDFSHRPDAYGVFLWWPEEGAQDWLHPYDRPIANDWLPGERVWKRHPGEGEFDLVCHGTLRFRARPRLWMTVPPATFWIGDTVEVLSEFRRRPPFIAKVAEVHWDRRKLRHAYVLERYGRRQLDRYTDEQLIQRRAIVDAQLAYLPDPDTSLSSAPDATDDLQL